MDKTDVIIIGAGIAGIASAYYLKKNFPNLSYRIIESRKNVGGTWDQMRFPMFVLITICIPTDLVSILGKELL